MDFLVPYIPPAVLLLFWLGFGMFYAKKVEKHQREVVEDHNRPRGHLTLVRQIDGTNYLRKLEVYLDGEPAGSILVCGSTYNDWKCMFMGFVDPRNYLYVRRAT